MSQLSHRGNPYSKDKSNRAATYSFAVASKKLYAHGPGNPESPPVTKMRTGSRKWIRPLHRLCAYLTHLNPVQASSCAESVNLYRGEVLVEEGASTVELAVAFAVVLSVLIGIMEFSLAFYSFHAVSDSAREATRFAMVRGSTACANTPSLTSCDATSAAIRTYVRGLGYPGLKSGNLTVTTTWLSASTAQPTVWSTCTTYTCNAPGNLVQVVVTYPLQLAIPSWKVTTVNISSTSKMVISQ
jgi:Flp pilus assembly protein TadG